ncbi:MAG TPA: ABC transporter permease [Chitinophagaceae bacterium]|nr:ABC transporter permease [Chitinophagaceae bacterium]
MFKNYFKIAWRNLLKSKAFSVINITGLAIGLSCFLLIALYVMDELSYDRFFPDSGRIYRVNSDIRFGGADLHLPLASDMMGQLLKKDYPQVEQYTRVYTFNGDKLVKKGSAYIDESKVANVDSTFFDVFRLPVIEGDTRHALDEPNTVVLTASAAKKYFGTTEVVGKTIEVRDDKNPYKITAVIKDIPQNAHFHFDFFFSMKNVDYGWGQVTAHNFYTYLRFKPGTDYKAFEKNFPEYIEKYVLPYARKFMNISSMDEFRKAGNDLRYSLTPLTKIHLYSDRQFELSPSGNIQYVYIFSAVALFILIIACINFMNLTTARSANRAREVGIRKVLGTEKRNLVYQFLFESTLMVLLSLVIAILIVYLVLPMFNDVANKQMTAGSLFSPYILPLLIALPFIVGLMAGSYPAFFLSSFKPIEVLKGKLKSGSKSGGLRSVLVVFQFATSIILIIGTIVVYEQLHYIQTKNLGYDKSQVLIIDGVSSLSGNTNAFKNEVLQLPGVVSGTLSGYLPVTNSARSDDSFSKEAVMTTQSGFDMQNWYVDYDYIKTLGMQIIRGRGFSKDFPGDSSTVIINETTAKILGYSDPVGKILYRSEDNGKTSPHTIIGVVKNFNFESLHQDVGPLCFFLGGGGGSGIFKVNTSDIQNIIAQAENKWKELAPGMPFSYRFLNQSFDEMYRAEQRAGRIALIFSVLAIFIACLGLFGLAAFIAEQRTKEIGIRKVLGASVSSIVSMLSKDFVTLVIIAFVLAAPLAWWAMHSWLQSFAYRIHISWWVFAAAGLSALIIALATVSFQAIKAGIANPVDSLRTE